MLRGIPKIISPELMKMIMEMGHMDELVLADGNFPAASFAKRLIRGDGLNIPELLDAILRFFPLDSFVEYPVNLMQVVPGTAEEPKIWDEYRSIIEKHNENRAYIEFVERFAFYEKTKKAYAIIATSERALYANIILKKGIVTD